MSSNVELLSQLFDLIHRKTKTSLKSIKLYQNTDNTLNWELILKDLIQSMQADYVTKQNLQIQLKSKELTIRELRIELSNLKQTLKDFGQLECNFQRQRELNEKLQKKVDEYNTEFNEIESELKSLRTILPNKYCSRSSS